MSNQHHPTVRDGPAPRNENAHGEVGAKEAEKLARTDEHKDSGNSAEAQRARLLDALRIGPVTTLEARRELDIMAPAARVMELRGLGHQIATIWARQPTHCGKLHRVARYVLTGGAP